MVTKFHSKMNNNKNQTVMRLIQNILLAIIGSFLKLFCSLLLVQGARVVRQIVTRRNIQHYVQGNPWFLVPWLVEETIEMVGGFIHFTIQATRNKNWYMVILNFQQKIIQYFQECWLHHFWNVLLPPWLLLLVCCCFLPRLVEENEQKQQHDCGFCFTR